MANFKFECHEMILTQEIRELALQRGTGPPQ